jgi:hypothetical protein
VGCVSVPGIPRNLLHPCLADLRVTLNLQRAAAQNSRHQNPNHPHRLPALLSGMIHSQFSNRLCCAKPPNGRKNKPLVTSIYLLRTDSRRFASSGNSRIARNLPDRQAACLSRGRGCESIVLAMTVSTISRLDPQTLTHPSYCVRHHIKSRIAFSNLLRHPPPTYRWNSSTGISPGRGGHARTRARHDGFSDSRGLNEAFSTRLTEEITTISYRFPKAQSCSESAADRAARRSADQWTRISLN